MVFSQILGFLWYGPLFGKMWLGFIGRKQEDMKMTGGTIGGSLITALIAAYVLALIIGNMGITGVGGGILAAAVVWIGIGAMPSLDAALYSEVHKGVWMLNALYNLVLFIGAGILFAAWPSL